MACDGLSHGVRGGTVPSFVPSLYLRYRFMYVDRLERLEELVKHEPAQAKAGDRQAPGRRARRATPVLLAVRLTYSGLSHLRMPGCYAAVHVDVNR